MNPTPLRKGRVVREQGRGHPEERMRGKSAGDLRRIRTSPPDIDKDLKETYDDKSNKEEKRYPRVVNRNKNGEQERKGHCGPMRESGCHCRACACQK